MPPKKRKLLEDKKHRLLLIYREEESGYECCQYCSLEFVPPPEEFLLLNITYFTIDWYLLYEEAKALTTYFVQKYNGEWMNGDPLEPIPSERDRGGPSGTVQGPLADAINEAASTWVDSHDWVLEHGKITDDEEESTTLMAYVDKLRQIARKEEEGEDGDFRFFKKNPQLCQALFALDVNKLSV